MAYEIVVVGASLGGLRAVGALLTGLPKGFPLPIAVVQHRSSASGATLSALLQTYSALPVGEPEDKEAIVPGQVYVAPADYHLLVEQGRFALSTEGPVEYARPSINLLFESAANAYAQGVIGVVLTGANKDGARGLARIKERGGLTVVQEPATAESQTMPAAAIAASAIDRILPLSEIAPFLVRLTEQP